MPSITLSDRKDHPYIMVSPVFLNDYMPQANGEFVKVYLCLLQAFSQNASAFSTEDLADRLSCTEGDILRALRYWESQGLLALSEKNNEIQSIHLNAVLPAKEEETQPAATDSFTNSQTPPPKPEQISRARLGQLMDDEHFSQLLYIVTSYIGKPLTQAEVNSLNYYYETLGFPIELIEYLVEYCVSKGHRSFRYIETVALAWHSEGVRTIEQARQHASQYSQNYFSVLRAFGVTGRNPIEQEVRMIDHWMKDYGFDTDLICEACSRTIRQINKVSFAYADSILSNWKNHNVHTKNDIETLDAAHETKRLNEAQTAAQAKKPAPGRASQSRFNSFSQRTYDYEKLEQQLLSAGKEE